MKKRAHKTRRQLQAEKTLLLQRLIDKANTVENPLESLHSCHKYSAPDGSIVHLRCEHVKNLSSECKAWIFELMEKNMKDLYEKSGWGWDFDSKKHELTEDVARYLIATKDNVMVGFSHFRFDIDYGNNVLYCYELQLEPSARRKGLGKFMMGALESIAAKYEMRKVVLTVLKNNPSGISFFHSCGYHLDNTNPSPEEKVEYIILSKRITKK